jgi:hypothetical protein
MSAGAAPGISTRIGTPSHEMDVPVRLIVEATRAAPKLVWEEVGSVLLASSDYAFRLRIGLQGWYGEVVGAEALMSWADEHGSVAHEIVACLTLVRGAPLPGLARQVLMRYGNEDEVRTALYANVVSGVWSGPGSAHYQQLRDVAAAWLSDPDSRVRSWANDVIHDLDAHIDMHRKWEEEWEFRTT